MTLTEIIATFKTKLNPSNILNSLERTVIFYNESDNNSEGNDSGEDLKNNPYSNSASNSIKSSINTFNSQRASQNEDPLIKLTNVWKIYQMGEVEFAALRGINLEIQEGEFLVVLGPRGSGKSTLMNLLGCLDLPSQSGTSISLSPDLMIFGLVLSVRIGVVSGAVPAYRASKLKPVDSLSMNNRIVIRKPQDRKIFSP